MLLQQPFQTCMQAACRCCAVARLGDSWKHSQGLLYSYITGTLQYEAVDARAAFRGRDPHDDSRDSGRGRSRKGRGRFEGGHGRRGGGVRRLGASV